MIFFGTNGTVRRTEPLPGVACPSCATSGSLHLSVVCRYAHVYWIPTFPIGKSVVGQCTHCQKAWLANQLPPALAGAATALKKETSAPLWHWSGLGILAVLIGIGLVANARDDQDDAAYLAAPRVGDIYTVRASDTTSNYSLLKVVSCKGNTLDLVANEYVINDPTPLDDLNSPDKYSKEPMSLTRADLQIMLNKGQLTDVDRLGE
ncbi:hypothetical protein LJY25_08910 [Hymenobacter sp. BT175]|uniref:hypothetical protein n=1 Tax=Hymenobacter translucens TaxID=2886507 RepID=UPI001D0DFB4B|nr:hypothetical protein [Hymenobacter translucens]MCC2546560.1 hypothetical protein [Hymenobacter translucens]